MTNRKLRVINCTTKSGIAGNQDDCRDTHDKNIYILNYNMPDLKFDKTCIPYPRKGLYWIINLFYLGLLILTSTYLWKYSIMISSIYISLYLISVILHGYLCTFSSCPYLGTFCPGIFAMFPVGRIATIFKRLKIKHSVKCKHPA
jgi:hypothetical protein